MTAFYQEPLPGVPQDRFVHLWYHDGNRTTFFRYQRLENRIVMADVIEYSGLVQPWKWNRELYKAAPKSEVRKVLETIENRMKLLRQQLGG